MRKLGLLFVLLFSLLLSACSEETAETAAFPTEAVIRETTVTAQTEEYTKEDILDLFNGYAYADPANRVAVDCVVVSDSAYDLIGVVMYTADDWEGCSFDFLNKDGAVVGRIGIGSAPAEDSKLEYLGNGVFSCPMLRTDGSSFLCKIIYSSDEENGTNFKVEEA